MLAQWAWLECEYGWEMKAPPRTLLKETWRRRVVNSPQSGEYSSHSDDGPQPRSLSSPLKNASVEKYSVHTIEPHKYSNESASTTALPAGAMFSVRCAGDRTGHHG